MSNQNPNLFFALHHWARRQDENFTTEALFSVIRLLQRRCPDSATEILNIVTHGAITAQSKADLLVMETQVHTKEGTPDAKITGQGIEVLLEVKVNAEIRTRQLESYLKLIESSHAPVAKLVLLSQYPPISAKLPEDVVTVRWYEIGECLEQLLRKQPAIDSICHHYVEEFLDFLCIRGLASTPVKTTLSAALAAYNAKTGGLPLYNYRFRSLESLNQYEELEPLVSLLKLMDMAIQSLIPSVVVRFDTGKSNGGWIGYNLNRMEYFFYIKLDRPETVVFETYRRQINGTTWDKSKGEDFKRGGRWRWKDQLDLSDAKINFFNASKVVQLSILEQFLQTSYAYAQQITLID